MQAHLVEGMVKDVRMLEWSWLLFLPSPKHSVLSFNIEPGMGYFAFHFG